MLQFNNDIISGEVSQSVSQSVQTGEADIFTDFHWIIIFSSGKAWINPEGRTEEPKDPDFFYPFWSTESRLFLRKFVHYKSSHWSKKKWFGGGGLSRVQTFSLIGIFVTYKQIYPLKKFSLKVSSLAACSDYVIMQMKEIDERIVCHGRSLKIMQ